jgi:hypothetical protein
MIILPSLYFSIALLFFRIQELWLRICGLNGLEIPKKVSKELKKRIQLSIQENGKANNGKGSKANKAKLNFADCGLNDRMTTFLIEILAMKPVIARLDLSGNYISDEVRLRVRATVRAKQS